MSSRGQLERNAGFAHVNHFIYENDVCEKRIRTQQASVDAFYQERVASREGTSRVVFPLPSGMYRASSPRLLLR